MKEWKQKKLKYLRDMKKKDRDEDSDDGGGNLMLHLACFYFIIEVVICLVTVAYFLILGIYVVLVLFGGLCDDLCSCAGETVV